MSNFLSVFKPRRRQLPIYTETVRYTNDQIIEASGAHGIAFLPAPEPGHWRRLVGGRIWMDFRGGHYGNIASDGVFQLYLDSFHHAVLPINKLRTFFRGDNSGLDAARFDLIPATFKLSDDDTAATEAVGQAGSIIGHSTFSTLAVILTGVTRESKMWIDNYDAGYNDDAGPITGGHRSNSMTTVISYVDEPIPEELL